MRLQRSRVATFEPKTGFMRLGKKRKTRKLTEDGRWGRPLADDSTSLRTDASCLASSTPLDADLPRTWTALLTSGELAAACVDAASSLGFVPPVFVPVRVVASSEHSWSPPTAGSAANVSLADFSDDENGLDDDWVTRILEHPMTSMARRSGGGAPMERLEGALVADGGLLFLPRHERDESTRQRLGQRGFFAGTVDRATTRNRERGALEVERGFAPLELPPNFGKAANRASRERLRVFSSGGNPELTVVAQRGGRGQFIGFDAAGRAWVTSEDVSIQYPVDHSIEEWIRQTTELLLGLDRQDGRIDTLFY